MKYILSVVSLLMTLPMWGQKIDVKEGNEKLGGAFHAALTVVIYEADAPMILKAWKKIMKDSNAKVKNSDDEVFADNATFTDVSPNTVDVYASIQKENEGVRFSVAFDLGGTYLSAEQNSGGFRAAKKMVYQYALEVTKEALQQQIKNMESDIKKMEWKENDLQTENDHLHRDIDTYKEKIIKAEKDLQANLKAQEEVKSSMLEKNKILKDYTEKSQKLN